MSNKTLIFLTKTFPFGSGESFIANEIPYLASQFSKVLIFCVNGYGNEEKRDLPANVKTIPLFIFKPNNQAFRKYKILFSSFFQKDFVKDYSAKTGKQKLFSRYFYCNSKKIDKRIRQELQKENISPNDSVVIYSYWLYDTALSAISLKNNFFQNNPLTVARAHRYDLYAEENPQKFIPYRDLTLENIDSIYTCSQDGERYLTDNFPKYKDKIETQYLGTKDYGLSLAEKSKDIHFISCSFLSPVKRVFLIKEAFDLLAPNHNNLYWTHIGGGKEWESLVEWKQENKYCDRINLMGNLDNNTILEYYQNNYFDFFINVSASEGLPVSIMEAISFGIPIIATNVGGTAEIVKDGYTGFLLPKQTTSSEVSSKIEDLLDMSVEEHQHLRSNCRKHWCGNFDSEKNYKKFSSIIYNLTAM